MHQVLAKIRMGGVVPVIKIKDAGHAVPLAQAMRACGGSWMAPAELVDAGAYEAITGLCRQAVQLVPPRAPA